MDIATIFLSGGTALATKAHWVRRAWALAEVISAIGNIAVNTQIASNPRVKEAVDIYNAAMGLIGLKNIGQGGYKFIKNLPERTKELLQKGEDLRVSLQQRYLKWKTLTNNLDNLTDAEKKRADVNEDGDVDAGDSVMISQLLLKETGDINGDKKIDEEDALLILKHDSGISSLTKEQEKRADLNNDGDVDASDAVIILRIINNNK